MLFLDEKGTLVVVCPAVSSLSLPQRVASCSGSGGEGPARFCCKEYVRIYTLLLLVELCLVVGKLRALRV
jgi:hypothetical protein